MTREDIIEAINGLEDFPLTENQQELINYLNTKIEDIAEDLLDEDSFIDPDFDEDPDPDPIEDEYFDDDDLEY